jgi:hypothetical protein
MPALIAKSNGNSFRLASCGAGAMVGMSFDEGGRPVLEDCWSRWCSPVSPSAFL